MNTEIHREYKELQSNLTYARYSFIWMLVTVSRPDVVNIVDGISRWFVFTIAVMSILKVIQHYIQFYTALQLDERTIDKS